MRAFDEHQVAIVDDGPSYAELNHAYNEAEAAAQSYRERLERAEQLLRELAEAADDALPYALSRAEDIAEDEGDGGPYATAARRKYERAVEAVKAAKAVI